MPRQQAAGSRRADQRQPAQEEEQDLCCPLCITELDATERDWLPCNCGYQLCLFCYDRIKTEFSNQCPGCRQPYDTDFQTGLQRRKARVAAAVEQQQQQQQPQQPQQQRVTTQASARPAGAAHAAAAPASSSGRQPDSPPSPDATDLHIEEEQMWPSLEAASQPPPGPGPSSSSARRQSRDMPPPPRVATHARRPSQPLSLEQESSSSASSATTTATTPRSPASSVVGFRASRSGSQLAALQGRCQVALQACSLGAEPDPEGCALTASLLEAVKAGSVSVKQAASSLASYLQRRAVAEQEAVVGEAGSLGSNYAFGTGCGMQSPAPTAVQLGLAGVSSSLSATSPFVDADSCSQGQYGAVGGGSVAMAGSSSLEGSLSASGAPSFSQWGTAATVELDSQKTGSSHGAGLFDGWLQQGGTSPVRSANTLPLYARQAGSTNSSSSSGRSGANFPGFPASANASPGTELKGLIAPPGFPRPLLGNVTGLASLPRFQ